ncbi:Uncharacterised protein [Mycobacteroides abscessus subsp. massiliense]|nr:Uncharacterised protein [Mycobacteroides abscessus subsp. massiliense]SKH73884.1 Uncharacterised protein [Mycobacteroides abscessus subsp. massiliense]SKR80332.1 Uncharacterised protein [Mycobacteroides abscessus subsp. massiliense]
MRIVHAVQTHLVRSALVITEFQTLAILKRKANPLDERPGVTVKAADGDRGAVEAHPASDPLARQLRRPGRRVAKPGQAGQRLLVFHLRDAATDDSGAELARRAEGHVAFG